MDATTAEFWIIGDDTLEVESETERIERARMQMADEHAEYVERMAVAMAEEAEKEDGGDEPPPPPATPGVVFRPPCQPLWAVLLAGSSGRMGPTQAECREARRRRRAQLDRAA